VSKELYERLRGFLDRFPGGFPATESGVELKILEKLFTPEEAEIFMKLKPLPERVSSIAPRLGMGESDAAEKLEDMARQGLIYRLVRDGEPLYMAVQFAVGIYEFHLNAIDRELSELMEEYLPHLAKTWSQSKTKQLRVAPSVGAVDATPSVDTYDRIRELVKQQKEIAVAPCICRKEQGLLGNECDRPHETCLSFGNAAEYYVENGMGRKISVEEALSILDLAEQEALVLSPTNTQEIMNICCCCKCCCGVLRGVAEFPRPAEHVNSLFYADIDASLCSACATCLDRCQMEAIVEEGDVMRVDRTRCIGCGLCVSSCPEEAISLCQKDEDRSLPKNMVEMGLRILKERGLA